MLTRQALIQIAEVYFAQLNFDYACFDADRSTKPGHLSDRKLTLYGGQQPVTPGSMAAERMWDLRE